VDSVGDLVPRFDLYEAAMELMVRYRRDIAAGRSAAAALAAARPAELAAGFVCLGAG
jgi:hypothetical protein